MLSGMSKQKHKITDIEVDGNTVRFINVCKGKAHEPMIIIESGRAKT